jgi:hypothetical protein
MRLVDPANIYFEDQAPRRGGPVYRGAAIFGPGVPGGSRQATPEEIEELREHAARLRDSREADPVPSVDSEMLARAVDDLIRVGQTTFGQPPHVARARVVTFWRGDSVLEITGGAGRTVSRARIPRNLGREHDDLLTTYLARHVGGDV